MCVDLAEAVVSSVAPLVIRIVDVATREMRESDSPAMKTQSLGSVVAFSSICCSATSTDPGA